LSSGTFPVDSNAIVANFVSNPSNRNFQPRAYANEYEIPEKVYQYTASVQQEFGGNFTATAAYVGSQGRELFLRSVANNIVQVVTNPNPTANAIVIREFSIVQRDANGNITGALQPYAEVDYKTSGGHDQYDAMMLPLSRRSGNGLAINAQCAGAQPWQYRQFERAHRREQRPRHRWFDYQRLQQLRRPPPSASASSPVPGPDAGTARTRAA
jgi:hypothetical protein